MLSENVSSADNQQERFRSIGYYIAGFVDGEGSFNVSLRSNNDYRIGWQIVLSFNVSQKDITMLNLLKDILACGIIKQRKRDNLYSYDVTKPDDVVNRVLPFFDRFEFISKSKKENYQLFKEISILAIQKPLSYENFLKIINLREELNKGKGRKRKYSKADVLRKIPRDYTPSLLIQDDIVRPAQRCAEPGGNVQGNSLLWVSNNVNCSMVA